MNRPPRDWLNGSGLSMLEDWRSGNEWAEKTKHIRADGPSGVSVWFEDREEEMVKVGDVYSGGSGYLKAEDLQGKRVKVVVSGTSVVEFPSDSNASGKEEKIVISLAGKEKQFVCNKTNSITLAEQFGTDETDDWIGRDFVLYPTMVSFGNKTVPGIRVADLVPTEEGDTPF